MNQHLSDDQLLDRLYGLEPDAHSCPECEARYREIELRRQQLTQPEPATAEMLTAQRRRILARIENRPSLQWKWVSAAAAAGALALALAVHRPAPAPLPVSHNETADAQLFSEIYAMEQSTEPRAAAPIHALFEDNQ